MALYQTLCYTLFEMKPELFLPLILSTLLVVFHLLTPSMFNANQKIAATDEAEKQAYAAFVVNEHETWGPVAKRPLTSIYIRAIENLGINIRWAFILALSSFFWFMGMALWHCGRSFELTTRELVAGQILFYSSFTILFCYFTPMDSYNDPVQYFCFFLTLLALNKKRYAWMVLLLFVALLERETTLFLLPGIAFFCYFKMGEKEFFPKILVCLFVVGLPALMYGIYLLIFPFPDMAGRFEFYKFNFRDSKYFLEAFSGMICALSLPFLLAFKKFKRGKLVLDDPAKAILCGAFVFILNTPIIFCFAKARETRLLALPLLFLWPFLGPWALEEIKTLGQQNLNYKRILWQSVLAFVVFRVLANSFYRYVDSPFIFGYRLYFALVLAFISVWLIHQRPLRQTHNSHGETPRFL